MTTDAFQLHLGTLHATQFVALAGLALLVPACGSHSSSTPMTSTTPPGAAVALSGQYEATTAGAISEISFPDSSHYALWDTTCRGNSVACLQMGTYAFNVTNNSLGLANSSTGRATSIPFEAETTSASAQSIRLGDGLRLLGGVGLTGGADGGIALTSGTSVALTFQLGGQGFSGNDPSGTPSLFAPTPPGTCKYPILLEHGFAASNEPSSPWQLVGVVADLMAQGHALVIADEVEPFGSVEARAATMAQTMATVTSTCMATPGCNPAGVHVIAHSYGGLHSREYLREHPPANSAADHLPPVVSLTTISTPNAGTNIADVGVAAINAGGTLGTQAANAFAGLFGSTFTSSELASNSDVKAALQTLSESNAPAFLASHPAVPGVSYFAWAGVSVNPNFLLHPVHPEQIAGTFPSECEGVVFANGAGSGAHEAATSLVLIPANEISGHFDGEPNDGMALVTSAKALPGSTFMGCIPADHLGEVGHASAGVTNWTGFDHLLLYRTIAAGLAALESASASSDAGVAGSDAGE